ncbi:carboxylating nicotinate-nucleotide diphosphorylase [Undibacterium flavidum]|uniref:nicotinate-nucleotide diphosphorylase (carboxylating) n=1 Tax=Undibacterium flavidum TaxID=2762297 RepID=A0ABR6YDI5_9BURK|nr:carboxylating nicotinate-nucleotide diphosphorylase [Undibacterium flavidum]MBC3874610.1 carboxylating nicotinate-nucleotide diphosphorylase [Undibacterium flavidum]
MTMSFQNTNLKNIFAPSDLDLSNALNASVKLALLEDVGSGDLTGELVPSDAKVIAHVVVREEAVLCGAPWFDAVMFALDSSIVIDWQYAEGALMSANTIVCKIHAPARSLLTAERSALNFMQLLSGVATAARRYVKLIEGTSASILDTRKTLPGMRLAQKYAVRVGGGKNQRLALYDGILIKENHIAAAGGIVPSLLNANKVIAKYDRPISVQIEVESLEQLQQALDAGATSILLDNFDTSMMREAVGVNAGRALLEASGGVDLTTVRAIAETGVDRISIGALTKDVKSVDFSLRIQE